MSKEEGSLKNKVTRLKSEVRRLENLLLLDDDSFARCIKCDKVKTMHSDLFECAGTECSDGPLVCKSCSRVWGCPMCDHTYCSDCKDIELEKCDFPGCKTASCCYWINPYPCPERHISCHDRAFHSVDLRKCVVCAHLRKKNATPTIGTALGLLKRKCSRDVYFHLMRPLLKGLLQESGDTVEWDMEEEEEEEKKSKTKE